MSGGDEVQVDPNDLLIVAGPDGHIKLITQLGEALGIPDMPTGVWPSQAAMAAHYGNTAALTQGMIAKLGGHSASLTAAAGQYGGQEGANAAGLKDGMGIFTNTFKDLMSTATSAVKDVEGVIGTGATTITQAVSTAGGALASSASSLMESAAKVTPLPGTPDAAPHAQPEGRPEHDPHTEPSPSV